MLVTAASECTVQVKPSSALHALNSPVKSVHLGALTSIDPWRATLFIAPALFPIPSAYCMSVTLSHVIAEGIVNLGHFRNMFCADTMLLLSKMDPLPSLTWISLRLEHRLNMLSHVTGASPTLSSGNDMLCMYMTFLLFWNILASDTPDAGAVIVISG